ncbi:MAG: hypothetical protein ACOCZ3_02450, partial [Bacillota bacterium]
MSWDYIIKNGTIMTMNGDQIIEDGYLAVEGSRIAELGKTEDLTADKTAGVREIDASGQLVMPGFVNAHNHSFNLLTRYMPIPMEGVDASDFGDVLTRWYWPKVEDNNSPRYTYLGSLLFAV